MVSAIILLAWNNLIIAISAPSEKYKLIVFDGLFSTSEQGEGGNRQTWLQLALCSHYTKVFCVSMGNLVPHIEQSAQLGRIEHYEKLVHEIFGVVRAEDCKKYVYVMDETVADEKDSEYVLSYTENSVSKFLFEPIKYLKHYLDFKLFQWKIYDLLGCRKTLRRGV